MTQDSLLTHAHVFISGTVQGVGYRISTVRQARLLTLQGWVRNLPDGRVEAVFEGAEPQVTAMIEWCHSGPPAAVVTGVSVELGRLQGLKGFDVR